MDFSLLPFSKALNKDVFYALASLKLTSDKPGFISTIKHNIIKYWNLIEQ